MIRTFNICDFCALTPSRSEIALLSQEKMYTDHKLEKLQRRNDELEEQCVQHGLVHETMKER